MGKLARTRIKGVKIGHAQDADALTGVTVIAFEGGATASLDARGSSPGTRETELLRPGKTVERVHAIVLSGGSAYGLDAAGGVMKYLEERGIGVAVGDVRVPIVPQAIIFDLGIGNPGVRPDFKMGYQACQSLSEQFEIGNYGAGCGATVGKIMGPQNSMKSGIGYHEMNFDNGLQVGALICVNAVGDVFDETGIIAGALNPKGGFADTAGIILGGVDAREFMNGNTTIGCVITNAKLDKALCQKVSEVAHNGLAQSISPIHTSMDGDLIFTAATGEIQCSIDQVCIAAQTAVRNAVISAVKNARSAGGIKSIRDISAADA